ncbi:MAG TPA: SIMPL domain-containing protein, partial [Bacteroidia bacterium]
NEVKAKLEELGVKKETIKTELNVSSYWYWNDNRQTNLTKQLTFCVNDFSIINEFVNETDIKGLQYMRMGKLSHKKILDYRKQVKIDALKAAKEKASYLLESIGKKAGDIINITELPEKSNDGWGYYYPQYYSNSNMLSNSSSYGGSQDGGANSEIRSIKLRYEVQSVFDIVE